MKLYLLVLVVCALMGRYSAIKARLHMYIKYKRKKLKKNADIQGEGKFLKNNIVFQNHHHISNSCKKSVPFAE